jgi:hypothetical protein
MNNPEEHYVASNYLWIRKEFNQSLFESLKDEEKRFLPCSFDRTYYMVCAGFAISTNEMRHEIDCFITE